MFVQGVQAEPPTQTRHQAPGVPGELSISVKGLSSSSERTCFALVDGGSTNGLRNEAWKGEAKTLSQVKVSLAVGHTTLGMTDAGVLVSPTPTQVILPMRYLHELGYGMSWQKDGCRIWKGGESLKVKLEDGCPTIAEKRALQLMCEFEQQAKTKALRLRSLKAVLNQAPVENPVEWLRERVSQWKKGADLPVEDLVRFLRSWAPDIPEQVVLSSVAALDPEGLKTPWNRRARRSHAQGKLLIHLFSGVQKDTKQAWGGRTVLSVEKEAGQDFRKPGVLGYLYALAAGGKVDGIAGGPPCKTFSRLRSETDEGPRPLREAGGAELWGRRDLSECEAECVFLKTTVCWCKPRFLSCWHMSATERVCQMRAVRDRFSWGWSTQEILMSTLGMRLPGHQCGSFPCGRLFKEP